MRRRSSASSDSAALVRRAGSVAIPGFFMLVFLAGGFLLTLLNPATFRPPHNAEVLSGEWTASYQAAFEDELPLRQTAVESWTLLTYLAFAEGRPGVLVGDGGWLFTTEEFAPNPDADTSLSVSLSEVEQVKSELDALGVELVIALVPAKARLYADNLGRYTLPAAARERYESARGHLSALGVTVPDLLTPLQEAMAESDVFLRTDTHWTPFGARVVAETLASAVGSLDTDTFETRELGTTRHHGDLLGFIPLGSFQERFGPEPDTLRQLETVQTSERGGGLFDEVEIPVALVGTSYSAHRAWNFAGALRQALGADVLNVAEEGAGPLAPMERYLSGGRFAETPPELIIWEVPERYLTATQEPDAEAGQLP